MFKWLDHIAVSNSMLQMVDNFQIRKDGLNMSDHLPVCFLLNAESESLCNNVNVETKKGPLLHWDKCSLRDLENYWLALDSKLVNISIPESVLHHGSHCKAVEHKQEGEAFFNDVMTAVKSADEILPRVKPGVKKTW